MESGRYLVVLCIGLAADLVVDGRSEAVAQAPPESLAIQIRGQGYPCDRLLSAERDTQLSKPDQAVWIVKCANAAYRMTVIPDMAARVEPLSR